MPIRSIEKTQNLESAAPKKGSTKSRPPSRRKAPSGVASPKKPPQSAESKTTRIAGVKMPPKADEHDGVRRYHIETRRGR